MSKELKMLKDKLLEYGVTTKESTSNGKSSMSTKLEKLKLRD